MTDHDIEKLIYLRKEDFDYKEWVALKYARDWTLEKGMKEPTGDYIEDYKKLYTEKEQKSIQRILQVMRWANYTSHTVLRGKSGKWQPDLQAQKIIPPYSNSALVNSDYNNNACPCVCLKPFPLKDGAANAPSVSHPPSPVEDVKESSQKHMKYYTACNLWYKTPYDMWSANFKEGKMIPAGTEVSNIHTKKGRLIFVTLHDQKRFSIKFCYPWHPGLIAQDYKNRLFTTNTFEQMTRDMSNQEIKAIKAGTIFKGMDKKAVLVSFGYPPEFATSDLNAEKWQYWTNKETPLQISFNESGKIVSANSVSK